MKQILLYLTIIFGVLILLNCKNKKEKKDVKVVDLKQRLRDTTEIINDDFIIKVFKEDFYYSNIIKRKKIDTLSLSLKTNLYDKSTKDTVISIRVDKIDTLGYFLGGKKIFRWGELVSDKFYCYDEIIRVGGNLKEISKLKPFKGLKNIKDSGVIWVSDIEGFSNVYLAYESYIIKSISLKSSYLD